MDERTEILTEEGTILPVEVVSITDPSIQELRPDAHPCSLNSLRGLLRSYRIQGIRVTETLPVYLELDFQEWAPELYTVNMEVWDWLVERADLARNKTVSWQSEGF